MGGNQPTRDQIAAEEYLVGFQNKTMTLCYANSILQILFHHPVFAKIILQQAANSPLMLSLQETLIAQKKQKYFQSISTSKLMKFIEKQSALFERERHQDSHQFYIWLMNRINDDLKKASKSKERTSLEDEFFSNRTTRTQCLTCHSVSYRHEEQVDLSLFLPQPNVSLNYCISHYSRPQKLTGDDKFKCEHCHSLQTAEKKTLIRSLPKFLTIHLRRFKYDEVRKSITKLLWLIAFPTRLKMKTNYYDSNQDEEIIGQEGSYKLVGVVAHLGQGQNYGHYVSYLRIKDKWYLFNDEDVTEVEQHTLDGLWGYKGVTKCAYMLFYTLI